MSRRSCFQFTNIARERTGRGSGSRSALGSSVRRRRAGARAAAQSQVGGRRGGGAGARGLPKPGGVAACGTCQEDEASAPPVSVFPLCHGAHIPQNTWGRGLRVHLRFRARTGIGRGRRPGRCCAESPRLLLLRGGLLPVGCPGPHGRAQDFLVRSVAQEEINRLCVFGAPKGMIDSCPGSRSSRRLSHAPSWG